MLGIGLAPGPIFSTQNQYNNFLRMSCTGVWSAAMEEGVERLGRLAKDMGFPAAP